MGHKKIKCNKCKIKNVRIYRPYGTFYRKKDNRCNDCFKEEHDRDWYVPCLQDSDGTIWGYTSATQEVCDIFYSLPDKNPKAPIWNSYKDKWSFKF